MGWYIKEVFKKDNTGKWRKQSSELEKAPTDIGRWQRSCELEKKSSLKERTYLSTMPTKTGINEKVTRARTYFGKNEKVIRTLITTSNKLPDRYRLLI